MKYWSLISEHQHYYQLSNTSRLGAVGSAGGAWRLQLAWPTVSTDAHGRPRVGAGEHLSAKGDPPWCQRSFWEHAIHRKD